jgi:hypothetical protein
VGEEEAVTEAIHAAAHPGRTRATDGEGDAGQDEAEVGAGDDDATASRPSEEETVS